MVFVVAPESVFESLCVVELSVPEVRVPVASDRDWPLRLDNAVAIAESASVPVAPDRDSTGSPARRAPTAVPVTYFDASASERGASERAASERGARGPSGRSDAPRPRGAEFDGAEFDGAEFDRGVFDSGVWDAGACEYAR
ncbi:hypothetical protein GCM10027169_12250 [Gordonia jinhuaensis]|uniref:Uncharacterized protein n=1 Tax=Gordonia jinhuaensis TaxID=1517702 RepID=A0A916WTQ6_9ACTN|nr:hypothetical protein GCM10011489_20190 [Gordonia jinhuaensis]